MWIKDSSSVEDGMVDAYNTSGMRFTIILFTNIFGGISVKRPLHRMRLTIKLGNWTDNEHSLTIVFSSRSFESRIRSCKLSSDIPWRKKALITIECFHDRMHFFRGRRLVFNLFRILLPLNFFFWNNGQHGWILLCVGNNHEIFHFSSLIHFCVSHYCASDYKVLLKVRRVVLTRFAFLDPNDVNVSKFTYLRTKF